MFHPSRRSLLAAAAALPVAGLLRAAEPDLAGLADLTTAARPIGAEERARRLARAQALMRANNVAAVLIEPGSSLVYFTGVVWWRSERLTAAILPVEGEPCIVTPFFEEPSVRETLAVPAEVRTWQEDGDPLAAVAGFLRDRKLGGAIGSSAARSAWRKPRASSPSMVCAARCPARSSPPIRSCAAAGW